MQINQETFEAWLFSQPRETVVDFGNNNTCFMCRFLRFMGEKELRVLPNYFILFREDKFSDLPDWFLLLTAAWEPRIGTFVSFGAAQDRYKILFPHHFAITDGTSRGDCSHLTGDIVVVTPAHNRETQPLMQNI